MNVIDLLAFEEGFREKPYIDTEGYPTAGIGIKLGPKGASLANYEFTIPYQVAQVWTDVFVENLIHKVDTNPKYMPIKQVINMLVNATGAMPGEDPRSAVLISMAYQMGLDGLLGFVNTLHLMYQQNWSAAADGMMKSKWARQTPARANRHAAQLISNKWAKEYTK
jgi:lysozyme